MAFPPKSSFFLCGMVLGILDSDGLWALAARMPPCCGFDQDLPRKFVVKCRSSQFSCSLGVVLESTGMSSPQTCPRKLCWWMAGSFVSCLQFWRRRVILPFLSLYILYVYISLKPPKTILGSFCWVSKPSHEFHLMQNCPNSRRKLLTPLRRQRPDCPPRISVRHEKQTRFGDNEGNKFFLSRRLDLCCMFRKYISLYCLKVWCIMSLNGRSGRLKTA